MQTWKKSVIGWSLWLLFVATAFGLTTSLTAQVGQSATTGLTNRDAIAANHLSGKTYIVDPSHNSVIVLTKTSHNMIEVGARPVSIAINERTNRIYVANGTGRSVSVIDGDSDHVLATLPTAARPYAVAADSTTNRVFISNTFSNMLTVIDGATNAVSSLKTGSADAIIVDEAHGKLYLLGYESDALTVVDEATGATSKLPTGAMHQWGIIKIDNTLYVTHVQDSSLVAIDLTSGTIHTIPVGRMPCALATDKTHHTLFVLNYGDASLTAINLKNHAPQWTTKVGGHPQALALNASGRYVAIADPQAKTVVTLDAEKIAIISTKQTSGSPFALSASLHSETIVAATSGPDGWEEVRR